MSDELSTLSVAQLAAKLQGLANAAYAIDDQAMRLGRQLDEADDRTKVAVEALRTLVETLPRCDNCDAPATKAHGRCGPRWCDRHGGETPDLPRAAALRRAHKVLERFSHNARGL